VPTNTTAGWQNLTTYLGGASVAGGKIKETGTLHWTSPNTGATNETGFTALPAGYRDYIDGAYKGIGTLCSLWSKDQMTSTQGFSKYVHNYEIGFTWIFNEKQYGMSVRCLRD
jgi:uncharacterized protein (TIGR02145 family)